MYTDIQILSVVFIQKTRGFIAVILRLTRSYTSSFYPPSWVNFREFIAKFSDAKTKRRDHIFVQEAVFIKLDILKTNKGSYQCTFLVCGIYFNLETTLSCLQKLEKSSLKTTANPLPNREQFTEMKNFWKIMC